MGRLCDEQKIKIDVLENEKSAMKAELKNKQDMIEELVPLEV